MDKGATEILSELREWKSPERLPRSPRVGQKTADRQGDLQRESHQLGMRWRGRMPLNRILRSYVVTAWCSTLRNGNMPKSQQRLTRDCEVHMEKRRWLYEKKFFVYPASPIGATKQVQLTP